MQKATAIYEKLVTFSLYATFLYRRIHDICGRGI